MADRGKRSSRRRAIEWTVLLAALAVIAAMRLWVILPAYVSSASMSPTIVAGDFFLVNRTAYRKKLPRPGDIVAFFAQNREDVWVKRVVAGPGDRVGMRAGVLYRNGRAIQEAYLKHPAQSSFPAVRVPAGHVFVLGDNRDNSDDSRAWGPLRGDYVLGKVFFIYWPWGHLGRPR